MLLNDFRVGNKPVEQFFNYFFCHLVLVLNSSAQ
jgi:hypothetical protein